MAFLEKKEIPELIAKMKELYPQAGCALNYDTRFHLLAAVMLSAQTTDKSVNMVTPALFQRFPEPKDMAEADIEELEQLLKRVGMYHFKAKNLKALSQMLYIEYNGEVPEEYEALVSLPGVGRKTANVVLAEGFGQQKIAVDTHVFRLAARIGLAEEKDVLKTEYALMAVLPEEEWTFMHHALIWHGRQVCFARNPLCGQCGIGNICRHNNVNTSK